MIRRLAWSPVGSMLESATVIGTLAWAPQGPGAAEAGRELFEFLVDGSALCEPLPGAEDSGLLIHWCAPLPWALQAAQELRARIDRCGLLKACLMLTAPQAGPASMDRSTLRWMMEASVKLARQPGAARAEVLVAGLLREKLPVQSRVEPFASALLPLFRLLPQVPPASFTVPAAAAPEITRSYEPGLESRYCAGEIEISASYRMRPASGRPDDREFQLETAA
jgi:hypothetical protein